MSVEGKHHYRFTYLKSEQWQNVRIEALAREKGKCQICGEESISNDAHHMWYPESIWETRADHLVILCRPCHDFIHSMIPECKTNDEEVGRANWLKFSNAIKNWRLEKITLFSSDDGLPVGPAQLRKELARVKSLLGDKGHPQADPRLKLIPTKEESDKFFQKIYELASYYLSGGK